MRTIDVDILTIPGWAGAGPDHWMTRWEGRLRTARRVEQADRHRPDLKTWTDQLIGCIAAAGRPVVLVAHSGGIATVVHASARVPAGRVVGAYLVAPVAEEATLAIAGVDPAFAPYPRDPLAFPSVVIASRNDAHCSYDTAGDFALSWGSTLVDAGDVGHLDAASGHGPWPEGAMRFGFFLTHRGDAGA